MWHAHQCQEAFQLQDDCFDEGRAVQFQDDASTEVKMMRSVGSRGASKSAALVMWPRIKIST